jgi:hypothetical protein
VVGLLKICERTARSGSYLHYGLIYFIEESFMLLCIFEAREILELFIGYLKLDELWDSL